jgi:peptidoglycan hydrolase CwlO-like protein
VLQVEVMQRELQDLQPVLAATAKEVEDMMVVIAHDKEEAAETKKMVQQQEREANEQAAAAKAIAGRSCDVHERLLLRGYNRCIHTLTFAVL